MSKAGIKHARIIVLMSFKMVYTVHNNQKKKLRKV